MFVKKPERMCQGSGNCLGFAAKDASGVLEPWRFDRRDGKILIVIVTLNAFGGVDCRMGAKLEDYEGYVIHPIQDERLICF